LLHRLTFNRPFIMLHRLLFVKGKKQAFSR
jgi:hypothetical protein